MNSHTDTAALTSAGALRRVADFIELAKPRVVLMVLITTFVGFYLGSADVPNYLRLLQTLFGTALTAGGTLALNQYIERDTDALMDRTRRRPLPDGRVQPREALWFGVTIALAGLVYLALAVNFLSALVDGVYYAQLSGALYADEAPQLVMYAGRRRAGCVAAGDRLGRGARQHGQRGVGALCHHVSLASAAHAGDRKICIAKITPKPESNFCR